MRIAGDEQARRGGVVDGAPGELGPLSAGAGAVAACHYPAGDEVRNDENG